MKTSIFIRSYPKDFVWLQYCLRSIQKFCTGFHEVVLALPEGCMFPATAERVVYVKERPPGYMHQQVSKVYADTYTDADAVLYCDSDCVFTEPVTPEVFMTGDKPNWLYTPWENTSPDAQKAWRGVMTKCLGEDPPAELMRRHPQLIPSWALQEFRAFILARHGLSAEDYIMSQPSGRFSEFNCLGFYLWLHHRDRIHWMNTEDYLPPTVLTQKWSHGGITPEIQDEFERILG